MAAQATNYKIIINKIKPTSQIITQKIIDDMRDRSGLGNAWDYIGDDIQKEIEELWSKIIEEQIKELFS